MKEYYSTQILEKEGFKNIRYLESEKKLLESLFEGTIDLAPFDFTVLSELLSGKEPSSAGLKASIPLNLDLMFLGFSPEVPKETVQKWQNCLDEAKRSGEFQKIYKKWLPGNPLPGLITVLTEQYPPVTFMGEDGKPSGFVTRIVEELLRRNGMNEEPILVPWSIGYELAKNLPDIILFSMDQTPQRKDLFEWIGPVGRNTAYLYALADSDIIIEDLVAAKKVPSIATIKNWWTEQLLLEKGFSNLKSSLNPAENVHQLMKGEVDLAIFTDLTVKSLTEDAGYSMEMLKPLLEVQSNYFYVAVSKGTAPALVFKLQNTLDEMKKDGSFEVIIRNELPNLLITPLLLKSSTPDVNEIEIISNTVKKGQIFRISLPVDEKNSIEWIAEIIVPETLALIEKNDDGWLFKAVKEGECVLLFKFKRAVDEIITFSSFAVNIAVVIGD